VETPYTCAGLMAVAKGEAEVKTATCEITNTSGVYPIYGVITLEQQVGRIVRPCVLQICVKDLSG